MEHVFDDLAGALTFAYRFSAQQYAKAQKIDPTPMGNGRGMIGLDGAGQAGLILFHAFELGRTKEAVLAARFENPFNEEVTPCVCCGHAPIRDEWRGRCLMLAIEVAMPAAGTCHERLAHELVMRHFLPKHAKRAFASIAAQFGEGEDKAKKLSYKVANALRALESSAQAFMGNKLAESGVVKTAYPEAA